MANTYVRGKNLYMPPIWGGENLGKYLILKYFLNNHQAEALKVNIRQYIVRDF